jgi:hypothetical protein
MLWCGGEEPFLGEASTFAVGRMVLGRYGGTPKNEDAAVVRCGDEEEYAVVADGHGGADSSALAVRLLQGIENPDDIVPTLMNADTGDLTGETAVLAVTRRGRFLRWLSIGDCVAYALHPQLAKLGQYALNQRSFYEWFGRVDSLRLDVPCYSSGVHALRPGRTRIVVLTDGALECGNPFDPEAFYDGDLVERMDELLNGLDGNDSATVIAWDVTAGATTMWPSS